MADLSQTPANVGIGSNLSKVITVQVGEAVTQGQPGYRDSATAKYFRADNNDTVDKANAKGIFLTPAALDGYAMFLVTGPVNLGATLTVGEIYVVSSNVGAIAPESDIATGNYVTILGVASSASILELDINATGIQSA